MNDDKIFIQDFEGNSKKGLIIVDDDSDVIIEQDAPESASEDSSASSSEETPHPHPHKWRWIEPSASSHPWCSALQHTLVGDSTITIII